MTCLPHPTLSPRTKGFTMAICASALWGLSGNVAQALFQNFSFTTAWLVNTRLLVAGFLCLMVARVCGDRSRMFLIWHDKKDASRLVIFAIFGMVGVQYTFFSSIDAGNAPTATLLQYACPLVIVSWNMVSSRRLPTWRELVAICMAIPGIGLLVTGGHAGTLSVSRAAIAWGLLSAVAAAFYIAYPVGLIKKWGAAVVTGWAMLVGGLLFTPIGRLWDVGASVWSLPSVSCIIFVAVFGTFASFYLYLESLRYITPTEASLLGSAEPLTAAAVSVTVMHTSLNLWQCIGGLLIMSMIFILSAPRTQRV